MSFGGHGGAGVLTLRDMIAAILGLPGCGKTRVAIELAALLAARDRPVLLLHTDLLKVTLRAVDPGMPRGSAVRGDLEAKLARVEPVLGAHVEKAERDGYDLIVEGAL